MSLRIISPEASNTIYLTLGTFLPVLYHTEFATTVCRFLRLSCPLPLCVEKQPEAKERVGIFGDSSEMTGAACFGSWSPRVQKELEFTSPAQGRNTNANIPTDGCLASVPRHSAKGSLLLLWVIGSIVQLLLLLGMFF